MSHSWPFYEGSWDDAPENLKWNKKEKKRRENEVIIDHMHKLEERILKLERSQPAWLNNIVLGAPAGPVNYNNSPFGRE